VQRLPMVAGTLIKKFFNAGRFPADVVAAWDKLADVAIEGGTLKLTMPKP